MRKDDVRETGIAGIKQRIKDGKYVVSLDLGREIVTDPKTGKRKERQKKSTRVVSTLKEAKALIGENNAAKRRKKITGTTGKVYIENVINDYKAKYYESDKNWSDSYKQQKNSQHKHFINYFGNLDLKKVDTADIEDYFLYCQNDLNLCANTIQKHKCHLIDLWRFMKKNYSKYGINENVVLDADYGKIQRYKAIALTIEQINILLTQCLLEDDRSVLLMVGLPALAGMRRSELCGLKREKIDFEKKEILVDKARVQINTGSIEKLPKGEKARVTCICNVLEKFIRLAYVQQEEWTQGKKIFCGDYVYLTKTNLVNDYLPHPGKVSRRFKELQTRINKRLEKTGEKPLPSIRLHDLRHSFISILLNSGEVNPFQVYGCAGHVIEDNTSTKTYWHDQGSRQEILDFLNKNIKVDFSVMKNS
ncbi:hypothetical protein D3Z51_03490 [Clostridiaceae bacterium]|nr:hypothetical protein [Clostridiaceae bacterium]RKI16850.1 hypothetical protein D7V81_03770 [bacterium 1XD21-70]